VSTPQKVEKKKFLVSPTIKAFCFPQKSFEVKNENQRNIQENKVNAATSNGCGKKKKLRG